MASARVRCLTLAAALGMLMAPSLLPPLRSADPAEKPQFFKGKVVPLKGLVEKIGSKLDADAEASWLALVTDQGDIHPLIKDEGSRMFFRDSRLLQRPMRLTGKLLPRSSLLQVLEVHSYKDGKLSQLYYWCDVCAIKRFEKKLCDCCGGPMELRETPVDK